MCPLCYAALFAKIVFMISMGILLVSLTDLRFGLPAGIVTSLMSYMNWSFKWQVPSSILIALMVIVVLRSVLILIVQEDHFVRRMGSWIYKKFKAKFFGIIPGGNCPAKPDSGFSARFWKSQFGRALTLLGS